MPTDDPERPDPSQIERWVRRFVTPMTDRLPSGIDPVDLVRRTVARVTHRMEKIHPENPWFLPILVRDCLREELWGERQSDLSELPPDSCAGRIPRTCMEDWPGRVLSKGAAEGSAFGSILTVETLPSYEEALSKLTERERRADVYRVELDRTDAEIAVLLGLPDPDAAAALLRGALERLTRLMRSNDDEE